VGFDAFMMGVSNGSVGLHGRYARKIVPARIFRGGGLLSAEIETAIT